MVKYLQDKDNQLFIFVMSTNVGVFVLVGFGVLLPAWLFGSMLGGFLMLTHSTLIPLLMHVATKMRVQVGPGYIAPSIEPESKLPPETQYRS